VLSFDAGSLRPGQRQLCRCLHHFVHRGPFTGWLKHKGVAKLPHHAFNCSAVIIGIDAAQIAQRLRCSAINGLKYEQTIQGRIGLGRSYGKAKLGRHIEARRRGRSPIQLHSGKIVNRVAATADQLENLIQAISPAWYFERCARVQAEMNQACNVGKIQTAELIVIWDIQEYGVI